MGQTRKRVHDFGEEKKLKVRDHLEDLGVNGDNGKINRKEIVKDMRMWPGFIGRRIGTNVAKNGKGYENVAWIHRAQDRDQCRKETVQDTRMWPGFIGRRIGTNDVPLKTCFQLNILRLFLK